MPFKDEHSAELLDTLKGYCRALGLSLQRADELPNSSDILTNITQGIDAADAVIVDLTGCNPNVMYELGILDGRKKPTVLLLHHGSSLCTNIQNKNYTSFGNLSETDGRRALIKSIDQHLENHGVVRPDTIIKDKIARTKAIVSSLHDLLRRNPSEFAPFSLRFSGGLSAIAIADSELRPADDASDEDREYLKELAEERDLMIKAASRGHRMRCLIHSPANQHDIKSGSKLYRRIEHLAEFLNDRQQSAANNNIEWRIATFRPPNIYIVGDFVVYEGFKKDGSRGYPLTLRTADNHAVRDRARLFDNLFDENLAGLGPSVATPGKDPSKSLRQVTLDQLRAVLKQVASSESADVADTDPS